MSWSVPWSTSSSSPAGDRVRIVTPTLIVLLPAAVFQAARYWDQVDTTSARFWTVAAYLVALCACGLYLARGDWRRTVG